MAKDWYLTKPPDRYSGLETEQFNNQSEEGFAELLSTFIAKDVELYSFDLSECKNIRAVVQGVVPNTTDAGMNREFLVPIGSCKAGMYFKYKDAFWLITGFVDNNGMYEKALAALCQYKLRWQCEDDKIIERWCNLTSASKYGVGITANNVISLTSNNYSVLIPNDIDSMSIDGKRVFIDKNETKPTKVFQITRCDDTLYDYGVYGGILHLIADETEFNQDTDNQMLRLCDYRKPSSLQTSEEDSSGKSGLSAAIMGNKTLKLGFPRTYTVNFTDENGNEVDWNELSFTWNVPTDLPIERSLEGNKISLLVEDETLVGASFLLQVVSDSKVISEIELSISVGW